MRLREQGPHFGGRGRNGAQACPLPPHRCPFLLPPRAKARTGAAVPPLGESRRDEGKGEGSRSIPCAGRAGGARAARRAGRTGLGIERTVTVRQSRGAAPRRPRGGRRRGGPQRSSAPRPPSAVDPPPRRAPPRPRPASRRSTGAAPAGSGADRPDPTAAEGLVPPRPPRTRTLTLTRAGSPAATARRQPGRPRPRAGRAARKGGGRRLARGCGPSDGAGEPGPRSLHGPRTLSTYFSSSPLTTKSSQAPFSSVRCQDRIYGHILLERRNLSVKGSSKKFMGEHYEVLGTSCSPRI